MTNTTTLPQTDKLGSRSYFKTATIKPIRTVRLLGQSEDGSIDLRITQGTKTTFYRYSPNAAGWTVDKWSDDQQSIKELYIINRGKGTCTCADSQFRRGGDVGQVRGACKHIAALNAVLLRMNGDDQ